jgi:MerR family transcriptional regulator, light-induced transcriptional regulator
MDSVMRIGELSRRTGVTPELLRAWEQRYGLLRPTRSAGGFRLYSDADEARVRRTSALIAEGLSAAEAARLAASTDGDQEVEPKDDAPLVAELAARLQHSLDGFDAATAQSTLDRLFAAVSVEFAISEVLIPYLHDLGERWAAGGVTVAQEHFASNLVRVRLLALAQDWGAEGAFSTVLACLPGEAHDLGLVMLGLLLARRGWQVTFLGADTPLDSIEQTVQDLRPSLIILATYQAAVFETHAAAIGRLAATARVAVMAPVDAESIAGTGAEAIGDDIPAAAAALAGL